MGHDCIRSTPGVERIACEGRNKGGMGVQPCEQGGGGNLQGMCKAEQGQYRHIVSPQFDLADIRMMYTRLGREYPLGQALLLSVLTDGRT